MRQRPSQYRSLHPAPPHRVSLYVHADQSCRWCLWLMVPVAVLLCIIVAAIATCEGGVP
jgi:hypothetical protein